MRRSRGVCAPVVSKSPEDTIPDAKHLGVRKNKNRHTYRFVWMLPSHVTLTNSHCLTWQRQTKRNLKNTDGVYLFLYLQNLQISGWVTIPAPFTTVCPSTSLVTSARGDRACFLCRCWLLLKSPQLKKPKLRHFPTAVKYPRCASRR